MAMQRMDGSIPSIYDIYRDEHILFVTWPNKKRVYFAQGEQDGFARKPCMTIYNGSTNTGLIAAHLEFSTAAYPCGWKYCLGDPNQAVPTAWKEVTGGDYMVGKFSWSFQTEKDGVIQHHPLMWKRTSSVFVLGVRPSPSRMLGGDSYKLLNTYTNQVHAAFTAGDPELGTLQIYDDYGGYFKMMALATLLGLIDEGRRRGKDGPAAAVAAQC